MNAREDTGTRQAWITVGVKFAADVPTDELLTDEWLDLATERIAERIETTIGLGHYSGSVTIVDAEATTATEDDDGNE